MRPLKDFVRDSWRIAAACAAGAFVLSLVVGLIAGNPFGIAISRAFLFAVLFAGLGVGLRAVVKAYLPEASGALRPASETSAPTAGSVDIVVPEDADLARQAFQGAGSGGEGAEEEPAEVLEAPDDEETAQAEAKALGELAEELGEEVEPAGEAAPSDRGSRQARPAGGEEAQEVQPEDELPRGAADVDTGELDALPDLVDLEPPPGQKSGPAARVPRAAVGETPEDAVRNLLADQDPGTLARAIRTALKKDEKG